jgi:hypothetical protein
MALQVRSLLGERAFRGLVRFPALISWPITPIWSRLAHRTSIVLSSLYNAIYQKNQIKVCSLHNTKSCLQPSVLSPQPSALSPQTFVFACSFHKQAYASAVTRRWWPPHRTPFLQCKNPRFVWDAFCCSEVSASRSVGRTRNISRPIQRAHVATRLSEGYWYGRWCRLLLLSWRGPRSTFVHFRLSSPRLVSCCAVKTRYRALGVFILVFFFFTKEASNETRLKEP